MIAIIFSLMPLLISAQQTPQEDGKIAPAVSFTIVSFKVREIKSNAPIVSTPAIILAENLNTGYKEQNSDYIDADGVLIYRLTPGNWRIQLRVDNSSTEQVDYFAEHIINIQPAEPLLNKSFYVRSVGLVSGMAIDAGGNPAADADLNFDCKAESPFVYQPETDKFGAFKTELPVGRCKISVAYRGEVGTTTVDVKQGSLHQVTIRVGKRMSTWLLVLVPLIIGILSYLVYYIVKRRVAKEVKEEIKKEIHKESSEKKTAEKEERENKERREERRKEEHGVSGRSGRQEQAGEQGGKIRKEEMNEEINPRARDIMATLNDREQKVVQYLLENNGMGSQANIRNHTGIPKTTLVRAFQSLEDKKVLSVEKIGKMKKVRLTEWFLGKE